MPARVNIAAPPRKVFPLRLVFSAFWLLLLVLLALNGGVLNRARGGMHHFVNVSYWSAHIRSRLLMAGPTAALVVRFVEWHVLYIVLGTQRECSSCTCTHCATHMYSLHILVTKELMIGDKCKTIETLILLTG